MRQNWFLNVGLEKRGTRNGDRKGQISERSQFGDSESDIGESPRFQERSIFTWGGQLAGAKKGVDKVIHAFENFVEVGCLKSSWLRPLSLRSPSSPSASACAYGIRVEWALLRSDGEEFPRWGFMDILIWFMVTFVHSYGMSSHLSIGMAVRNSPIACP